MSAVYKAQDDVTASFEAKKLADEIIASQSKGKAENLDIKTKIENLDSIEMSHLIGILKETFDVGETPSIDNIDTIDPALIQDLKAKFKDLIDKIKERPDLYLPSLCVDGKLSSDLAAKFCAGQAALISEFVKSPSMATTSSSMATSTAPAETTETDSTKHNYSSYLAMAKCVGDVAYALSFIQAEVTENSSLQTKWLAEENEAVIRSAQTQLDDIISQIAKIASQKKHARHLRRTMGTLTHILGSICVALSILSCNPGLILLSSVAFADQEAALNNDDGQGFIEQGTNELANLLILSFGGYAAAFGTSDRLPPEVAKILAAVLVVAVVGGSVGVFSESKAAGVLVGAFLAQSDGLFTDIADAVIIGQHLDPNSKEAGDIRLSCAVVGAGVCLIASGLAAYSMAKGAGTTAEQTTGSTLSQVTKRLQQMMADFAKYAFKISQTTSEQIMTWALAFGTASEIGLMISQSILSGILATNLTQTAELEKKLNLSRADLELTQVTADQLETFADTQAAIAEKEVSKLAESMNSYLQHVNQAALGSVIQV